MLASVTINATMEVNYDFIIVTDGAGNQLNTQEDGEFVDDVYTSADGTITVQVLNDSGVENGDVTLAFACVSLSNPENERLDMIIYPNPTDNILFIKGNKNSMNVSIYNILGKEVLSKMNTNNIDVKILPKGVYIIKISDDTSQINRKFIRK